MSIHKGKIGVVKVRESHLLENKCEILCPVK